MPALRAALIPVVLLLALAPAASAHIPGLEQHMRIAERTFPQHCGPLVVKQLHEIDVLARFYTAECVVAFPSQGVHRWPPSQTCHVLTHELGHAAGLGHSTEPTDVMYPYFVSVTAPCRKRYGKARAAHRPVLID